MLIRCLGLSQSIEFIFHVPPVQVKLFFEPSDFFLFLGFRNLHHFLFLGSLDFIDLLIFSPFQSFIFGFPSVDVIHSLVEFILDVIVVLVHILDLLQGLVVFALHIGIHLRHFLLVFIKFNSLSLDEFLQFVVLLLKPISVESPFSQFLDLDLIAVSVQIFSLDLLQSKYIQVYLSL